GFAHLHDIRSICPPLNPALFSLQKRRRGRIVFCRRRAVLVLHCRYMRREQFAFYFRNFIFGVEDSLVSTVGLLSGIAISDVPRASILLSGLVLICVEAFSMGVGSFLAEDSGRGVLLKKDPSAHVTVTGGLVMFISYFCAGFLPLAPYIFLETYQAFP